MNLLWWVDFRSRWRLMMVSVKWLTCWLLLSFLLLLLLLQVSVNKSLFAKLFYFDFQIIAQFVAVVVGCCLLQFLLINHLLLFLHTHSLFFVTLFLL